MKASSYQSGYRDLELIHDGKKCRIFRGLRETDLRPVILKATREYPSPKDVSGFRHEYEITKNLDIDGIVRILGIEDFQSGVALIEEDFDGRSLRKYLAEGPLELADVLSIGIKLADILSELHNHGIIHKDIKPSNIIINLAASQVKLADFSIAQNIIREDEKVTPPDTVEGTLLYMSPEQTGRMNRVVDHRSDFYSLGITLYEMLTGRVPFPMSDLIELVHCHIAKTPLEPAEVDPAIPHVVSDIIMKLLAKNAEDRYQSAFGIKADLQRCESLLQSEGRIPDFFIGLSDVSERLSLPQKLYGRQRDLSFLMEAYGRIAMGAREVVLVCGYAGIGKTSLVHELYRPIFQRGGIIIEGKFEQYKRDIPYSAIINAMRELVRMLLLESRPRLDAWREQLLEALGVNGRVITEIIPDLELITGPQPSMADLGPTEAKNRFNMVFLDFIRVFAQRTHPLVIFLDDLQYADSASMKLLETIMSHSETSHLLLIGAYRDNEVSENHPLLMTMDDIRQAKVPLATFRLEPLGPADAKQMTADMLNCDTARAGPLAELVLKKTGGNHFFVNEFIRRIYQDGQLRFNHAQGSWEWDIAAIEGMGITDNMLDLLISKIRRLSDEAQDILHLASCVGNSFDLKTIAMVSGTTLEGTAQFLRASIREGLLVPLGDAYKLRDTYDGQDMSFRFPHDRVQEASHSLYAQRDNASIHLKIGRVIIQNTPSERLDDRIFEIVDHVNKGLDLITDLKERMEVAELNLRAGKKAKVSTAYEQAVTFIKAGIKALPEDAWESRYDLVFALYRELSECEYLRGSHEHAEELFDYILQKASNNIDKGEIYAIRIVLYANVGRFVDNNRVGSEALRLFGIYLPDLSDIEALKQAFAEEVAHYRKNLGSTNIPDLINLPETTDPEVRMSLKLFMNMISSAYVSNPAFFALIGLKAVNLSLTRGVSPDATYPFCAWGGLLGVHFADYKSGYEFGELALHFNDKYNNPATRSNTPFVFGNFINHWKRHVKDSIVYLKDAYRAGIETGDFIYASFAATSLPRYLLSYGHDNLDDVFAEIEKTFSFFRKIKNLASLERQDVIKHAVLNLIGIKKDRTALSNDTFDETAYLEKMKSINYGTGIALLYFYKLQTFYIYGEYTLALKMAEQAIAYRAFIVNSMQEADLVFFHSLCLTALYPSAPQAVQDTYRKALEENMARMLLWSEHCPENFSGHMLLMEAESASLAGDLLTAIDLYDRAIKAFDEQGFLSLVALANECAGRFHLSHERRRIAASYLQYSLQAYSAWGARGKVRELDERYKDLISPYRRQYEERKVISVSKESAKDSTDSSTRYDSIDLISAIKASRVISSEIILDTLISSLMKIVVENAGASNGMLIIERGGSFIIMARSRLENEIINTLTDEPYEHAQDVPQSIINYVLRTGEAVVLKDASTQGRFIADPYIVQKQAHSVLCMPIVEQTRIIGILYLENTHVKDAFTPERIVILKLLSSQAAISLKNALNYDELAQAKETLKVSEDNYRVLFENLQDTFYRANMDGRIVLVSPSVEKVLGYKPFEILEMNIAPDLYVNPEKRKALLEILAKKGAVEDYEVLLKHKDGTPVWIATNSHLYRDRQGNVVGVEGMLRNITERKQAEKKLNETLESLRKSIKTTIQVLGTASETRDPYTAGHQKKVADLARAIATEMKLPNDKIEGIRMAGAIHDIGKISIPAEILSKPSNLTDIELSLIQAHTKYSYEIIKDVESPWPLADIVYQHHERINGSGYPRGLKGEDILMEARILAVADVVEAMISFRPYRAALGIEAALEEIEKNKGILYDNVVADACLKLFREKDYQLT